MHRSSLSEFACRRCHSLLFESSSSRDVIHVPSTNPPPRQCNDDGAGMVEMAATTVNSSPLSLSLSLSFSSTGFSSSSSALLTPFHPTADRFFNKHPCPTWSEKSRHTMLEGCLRLKKKRENHGHGCLRKIHEWHCVVLASCSFLGLRIFTSYNTPKYQHHTGN